jgi:hypothetical protein
MRREDGQGAKTRDLGGGTVHHPSVLVLDPRVNWEPKDVTSAQLIVPYEGREETLRIEFDLQIGIMRRISGMRYPEKEETKIPWRGRYSEWRTLHGVKVRHRAVAV